MNINISRAMPGGFPIALQRRLRRIAFDDDVPRLLKAGLGFRWTALMQTASLRNDSRKCIDLWARKNAGLTLTKNVATKKR